MRQAAIRVGAFSLAAIALAVTAAACGNSGRLPLTVSVPGKTMSKLPFVIANTEGLYEKHGLDVDFLLDVTQLETEAQDGFLIRSGRWLGRELRLIGLPRPIDIVVNGHGPAFIRMLRGGVMEQWVSIAATDCAIRYYVIARPGIASLDELHGKRLGINSEESTAGYAGVRLVQRMGWQRGKDISIVRPAGFEELQKGVVDAIVGGDETLEEAEGADFVMLEDTRTWNEQLAGNSVMVAPGWLSDETNREAARRFLRATVEAVALFHERPDVVMKVAAAEYGLTDRQIVEARYRRADYVPRKPFPCSEGVGPVLRAYHLEEMREYTPQSFYDETLMKELDESGYIDGVYRTLAASR